MIRVQPHAATAVAVEDTELIVLSRNTLLSLLKSDLELFSVLILNIATEPCRRLHETEEILLHYVSRELWPTRRSTSSRTTAQRNNHAKHATPTCKSREAACRGAPHTQLLNCRRRILTPFAGTSVGRYNMRNRNIQN